MSAMTAAPAAAETSSSSHSRGDSSQRSSRRGRRPYRGRPTSDAAVDRDVTVNVVNEATDLTSSGHSRAQDVHSRAQRPTHRGSGRAGVPGRHNTRVVDTRSFGGSLTTSNNTANSNPQTALQAEAQEFQPGQQYPAYNASRPTATKQTNQDSTQKQHPKSIHPKKQKRRFSKSNAPDIATRIHEDIDNGQYECPICTSEVLRKSKVWSCRQCWTVFHLDCIKKWSNNTKHGEAPQNGHEQAPKSWRCPGCNLPQDAKPKAYMCWCEKETEPRPAPGLPPHSCGQTCAKHHETPKKCPHPCELMCHAGPCPPCHHMGPTQRCFCGKEAVTKRCIETDYETGWSCGQICGDLMPCGEHTCPQPCHSNLCGACAVRIDARCYCGKEEKALLCCDKDDEEPSQRTYLGEDGSQVTEQWTGLFQCANLCNRFFDCQIHKCEKLCHPCDDISAHCPRSTDVVTHCPCGKTPLNQISNEPRSACSDVIPHCNLLCSKELPCGHFCQQNCHTGECMPCMQNITIHCRCGRTVSSTICHQGMEETPQCTRICKVTLNCGRHECGERCCSGEKMASERLASKRKQRPLNSTIRADDAFEAEHICTRVCGKLLKCGNHTCNELCHRGPCGSCREAIFDELACHCGRTVLQPPVPCGTKAPPCRFDCERPKSCGHPQVQHNCHPDDESCPKCPFLVEKQCICGKKALKNQKCWFTDVRCGEVCGRKLKCGSHLCRQTCHKPGECEDQIGAGICQQACGKPKKSCSHPCEESCHAPYPCREEKPCQQKTIITCECQNIKSEVRCTASKSSPGNNKKTLPCNDECARLERNRKLALALEIDPATHTDDHVPYSTETLKLFQSPNMDPKWLSETEQDFRLFAANDEEKRLRFKPMPSLQRSFLHSLSEDFGFDSESMDPEPHRHVALFKTPRFVSAPMKTLRDCIRIQRNNAANAAAEAQARYQERQIEKEKSQINNIKEPYNGFLLTNPRFALTIDELQAEVAGVLGFDNPQLSFKVQFLPSGDVALKALPGHHTQRMVDTLLKEVKFPLARQLLTQKIGSAQLARFDDSLNVQRREDEASAEGGWSKVAAKAAAPKKSVAQHLADSGNPIASRSGNGFTVLGNLSSRKKKKDENISAALKASKELRQEDVVDDWEAAELEAERREAEQAQPAATVTAEDVNSPPRQID